MRWNRREKQPNGFTKAERNMRVRLIDGREGMLAAVRDDGYILVELPTGQTENGVEAVCFTQVEHVWPAHTGQKDGYDLCRVCRYSIESGKALHSGGVQCAVYGQVPRWLSEEGEPFCSEFLADERRMECHMEDVCGGLGAYAMQRQEEQHMHPAPVRAINGVKVLDHVRLMDGRTGEIALLYGHRGIALRTVGAYGTDCTDVGWADVQQVDEYPARRLGLDPAAQRYCPVHGRLVSSGYCQNTQDMLNRVGEPQAGVELLHMYMVEEAQERCRTLCPFRLHKSDWQKQDQK